MHREARAAIIGQLREVADGRCAKSFGTGQRIEWRGKLGLVAGVTPVIDEQHAFLAVMGERFLLFRMPDVDRRAMARRSLAQRGAEADLRRRIHDEVADFLDDFKDCGPLPLPDSFMDPLITLSDIVTRARSGVARDGYSRDLLYLPEPEAPTRLAKQLAQLGAALITMGVDEREAWRVVRKCGWDSVPAVRTSVLAALKNEPAMTMAAIEEMAELPKKTTQRVVEDLVALRLASRTMVEGKWYVEQSKTARDYWTEDSWPETSEGVQGTAGPRRRRDGTAAPDAAPKATEEDFWPAFAGLWQQAAVQTGNLVPKAILEPAIVSSPRLPGEHMIPVATRHRRPDGGAPRLARAVVPRSARRVPRSPPRSSGGEA